MEIIIENFIGIDDGPGDSGDIVYYFLPSVGNSQTIVTSIELIEFVSSSNDSINIGIYKGNPMIWSALNGYSTTEVYYSTNANKYLDVTITSSNIGDNVINGFEFLPSHSDIIAGVNQQDNGFLGATVKITTSSTNSIWYKLKATVEYHDEHAPEPEPEP